MKCSKHLADDHTERAIFILTTIGLGNEILKLPERNQYGKTWHCITDTGILIVKSEDEQTVITMFALSINRLYAYYHIIGKKPPQCLIKKVENNRKKGWCDD